MYLHVCGCAISIGEGSSKVPTIIVQDLRFDDARFAAYCDWSAVKAPDVRHFFLTVELFSTFFYVRCGRKKRRERRLKETLGAFSKSALLHGNTM